MSHSFQGIDVITDELSKPKKKRSLMAKATGIVGLICGAIAMTPVPLFLAELIVGSTILRDTILALSLFMGKVFWILLIFPIAGFVLGVVGTVTAKEDSKAPGILGIVFGAIGFFMQFCIWPFLFIHLTASIA